MPSAGHFYCKLCEAWVIPNVQITDRPILRCPRCRFHLGEWKENEPFTRPGKAGEA